MKFLFSLEDLHKSTHVIRYNAPNPDYILHFQQRLGLDCSAQYVDGVRHTPLPLSTAKLEAPANSGDSQTYNQYVSTVKSQIGYAREIHDTLLDCSNKLGEGKT